jgi:carboxypeptidase C (cathepsin A)
LSEYLLSRHGIALDGIVLISSVLNFQTLQPGPGNELPFPLYLPSYTAAAWYHKKLPAELQDQPLEKVLKEVEAWAMGDYLTALGRGDALADGDKRAVAEKLARYTGLPVEWIMRADLRVAPQRFMKQLLIDERKVLGRFDSRLTGFDADANESEPSYDPSLSAYLGVYSADFNNYIRGELKYESDLPYEVLTRVQPWNFGPAGNGYLYVADDLRNAILKNPRMRVMFCSGRIDLATPYMGTDYTIAHMGLPKELGQNIVRKYYPAGHMMYHDDASRKKLHEDIVGFIESAAPRE